MKRLIFFVIVIVLSFSGICFAQLEVDNCINYLKAGDYQRAIEAGKRAVKLYPDNFDAHLCLGVSYNAIGEFDLALTSMKNAERLAHSTDELSAVYNQLGLIYVGKGDLDNALLYFSRKLSLDISTRVGDYHGAARTILNLGDVYRSAKDFLKAEENLKEGLKGILNTGDKYGEAAAYGYLGLLYSDMGDISLARDYLKKAYELFNSIGAKAKADEALQSLR